MQEIYFTDRLTLRTLTADGAEKVPNCFDRTRAYTKRREHVLRASFCTPDCHRALLENKQAGIDAWRILNPWIFKKDEP